MTPAAECESQAVYHRQLFSGLYQWDDIWAAALDLMGGAESAVNLGLDQLGLFGPRGVTLVAERLVATTDRPPATIVELGSGFGGAIRQVGRELRTRGMRPGLIGLEMVPEHCQLAAFIGRRLSDNTASIVQADVRCLPLRSASVDAVFAVGSVSHFASVGEVLAESRRVLRPGGVLAMTEEVSIRPRDAPVPGDAFTSHHPFVRATSPEQRRSEVEAAGLAIESFESLASWAGPLLRQRVQMLRFLSDCAAQMYGAAECERIIGTLTSAADEYEQGSIQPILVVARRAP